MTNLCRKDMYGTILLLLATISIPVESLFDSLVDAMLQDGTPSNRYSNEGAVDCTPLTREVQYEDNAAAGSKAQMLYCRLEGPSARRKRLNGLPPEWIQQNSQELLSGESLLSISRAAVIDDTIMVSPDAELALRSNPTTNRVAALRTIGARSVVAIRVVAALNAQTTASKAVISDKNFGTDGDTVNLKQQMQACSFNKLIFEPFEGATTSGHSVTDGVVEVTISDTIIKSGASEGPIADKVELEAENLLGPLSQFDHVMICLPGGLKLGDDWHWAAYAYPRDIISVYNNNWCLSPTAQMHEIGHNLNLAHAWEGSKEYGDTSGIMGSSYIYSVGPRRCFNGAKSWQLGWYSDRHQTVWPLTSSWSGRIIGVANYDAEDQDFKVVVKLEAGTRDYFVAFNRKIGINDNSPATSDLEGQDQVMITTQSSGYSISKLESILNQGERMSISNFNYSGETVVVEVNEINLLVTPGYADVSVYVVTDAPTEGPIASPTRSPLSVTGTEEPSNSLTGNPTERVTSKPTNKPKTPSPTTANPTVQPSPNPTTHTPSLLPTTMPSDGPSSVPSSGPSSQPSSTPSSPPSTGPSAVPSSVPSAGPSTSPSSAPSSVPTLGPSSSPSSQPSSQPSSMPSDGPSSVPSSGPSSQPSSTPSSPPSTGPSAVPSSVPSAGPSTSPSSVPSSVPTLGPSSSPSSQPSSQPSSMPSDQPSPHPTSQATTKAPTLSPTAFLSIQPSPSPVSASPSLLPTSSPTAWPSSSPPTPGPSPLPTDQPSPSPTSHAPSVSPTKSPTLNPTALSSVQPSSSPTSEPPSPLPTSAPTARPSSSPPTPGPSPLPTDKPSPNPTPQATTKTPTLSPTASLTVQPSPSPVSASPSPLPTRSPTARPSSSPPTPSPTSQATTKAPTLSPTAFLSIQPSPSPISASPSPLPTSTPTARPSSSPPTPGPSPMPTDQPSLNPTSQATTKTPTLSPTTSLSDQPSPSPVSASPSLLPTSVPTARPSSSPTIPKPTMGPTASSSEPSAIPSSLPSSTASSRPSVAPSIQTSSQPSADPTLAQNEHPSMTPSTFSPTGRCPNGEMAVDVVVLTDNYPSETSWTITNAISDITVASGDGFSNSGTMYKDEVCLGRGPCYKFNIIDDHGDGMCCRYGLGNYSVLVDGEEVASGDEFGSSEATQFEFCSEQNATTTFAAGNGQAGNMFDMKAYQDIAMVGFDIHTYINGEPVEAEVYTKAGSHQGYETDQSAWTMVMDTRTVIGKGSGNPTALGYLDLPISIKAGTVQSFYVTLTAAKMRYTNGGEIGSMFAKNTVLEFYEGVGKSYKFGWTFTPRIWNGVMKYSMRELESDYSTNITAAGSSMSSQTMRVSHGKEWGKLAQETGLIEGPDENVQSKVAIDPRPGRKHIRYPG